MHRTAYDLNLALWAMVGIPIAAVLASVLTLVLAIDGADPELPASFATEGRRLDEDFRLRAAARRAEVAIELAADASGRLEARLRLAGGTIAPSRLRLELTHATDPARDLHIDLRRVGESDRFVAQAAPIPAGRWIARIGEPGRWHVVARVNLPAVRLALGDTT
jgi:hypothetical protein